MKKVLAIALVVVMMMAMSVTAFAADTSPVTIDNINQKHADIPVYGRFDTDGDGIPDEDDKNPDTAEIIAVTISWNEIEFTYSVDSNGVWDPGTLSNIASRGGAWSTNVEKITVENRSNVDIKASVSFTATQRSELGFAFDLEFEVDTTKLLDKKVFADNTSDSTSIIIVSANNQDSNTGGAVAYSGAWDVSVDTDKSENSVNFEDKSGDERLALGTITVTVEQYTAPVTP